MFAHRKAVLKTRPGYTLHCTRRDTWAWTFSLSNEEGSIIATRQCSPEDAMSEAIRFVQEQVCTNDAPKVHDDDYDKIHAAVYAAKIAYISSYELFRSSVMLDSGARLYLTLTCKGLSHKWTVTFVTGPDRYTTHYQGFFLEEAFDAWVKAEIRPFEYRDGNELLGEFYFPPVLRQVEAKYRAFLKTHP